MQETEKNKPDSRRLWKRLMLGALIFCLCVAAGAIGKLALAKVLPRKHDAARTTVQTESQTDAKKQKKEKESAKPATSAQPPTTQPTQPAQPTQQTQTAQTPPSQTPPEQNKPKPIPYLVADKYFTNLRPANPATPIYDQYTATERADLGLPVELPDIEPYEEKKVAYLTFDDGPDLTNTPQILDILKEQGVPATFYVVGWRAEENPDVIKRIFNEGHAIGNHTYDHNYDTLYSSPNDFLWQVLHTDEILRGILGVRPLIVRAPGGTSGMFTDTYWTLLDAYGYTEHDWNVCTNDATEERPDAARQLEYVDVQTNRPKNGDAAIVLMHCTSDKTETVKALPEIIRLLRSKGYTFGVVTPMTPQPY